MKRIFLLAILAVTTAGCQTQTNRATNTTTLSPEPNTAVLPSPTPPTTQTDDLPQDWTWVYDGVIGVRLAYPNQWELRPALSREGELAVTSFDPNITPNSSNISAEQIKVAVTYFGPEDTRDVTFEDDAILNQQKTSIDNYAAVIRDVTGQVGTSKVAEIDLNTEETYLITAYPLDSTYIEMYIEMLSYIDLDATAPVVIETPNLGTTISEPLDVRGQVMGSWMYEGLLEIQLQTSTAIQVAQTNATTSEDWMTNEMINFSSTLPYTAPDTALGALYLYKGNPSGLPNNAEVFTWPIRFN